VVRQLAIYSYRVKLRWSRTKQYYQFIQKEWMEGDSGQPPPPPERKWVRNRVSSCPSWTRANAADKCDVGMETHVY
jgi:hypothetical protein